MDRTFKLFNQIGNPEKGLNFIHVAGTNGKGSVCAILAKALQNAGYKVGFYSSPHLVSLRERFRINGKGIPWSELTELVEEIWPVVEDMVDHEEYITFFEVSVAIAARYFQNHDCDFVLWETGLGGRLDSTNIVAPVITAITGIGLDHEEFLGDTEEKIAGEKAGIIKEDIPVFVGKMSSEAYKTIKAVAEKRNAPLYSVKGTDVKLERGYKNNNLLPGWYFYPEQGKDKYFLPFTGNVQSGNLKLAYGILKYMAAMYKFDLKLALQGIETLRWPGRIQVLPDGKILDGAHNAQGIEVFVETLQCCFPNQKYKIIFGCLAERNPQKAIEILKGLALEFIFVPIDSSRECFSPERILDIARNIAPDISMQIVKNSDDALSLAGAEKTVIIGSLYLAGEVLKKYYKIDDIIEI